MAYEDQIYKRPDTGKYYSIVNGIAREFIDQSAAAQLAPNAQALEWGRNTSGYSQQFGGGTTGGAWSTSAFTGMLSQQAQNAALNQAAEQKAAQSNAMVPQASSQAPTEFQTYFQGELAKGRTAQDILSNNPYMAGQAQGPKRPAGWDAVTYNNFKNANPGLEPDAQDTYLMQNAGTPEQNKAYLQSVNPSQVVPPPPSTYTIQRGDTLSAIAKRNGTDVATLMKLNPNIKNANLIQAGASLNLPGKSQAPAAPATITPEKMQGATNVDLSKTTSGQPQAMAETKAQADVTVSEAAAKSTNLQEKMSELTPPETELDRRKKQLFEQIVSGNQEIGKLAAQQLTEEQSAKIPEKKAALAELNSQILTKTAEYKAIQAQYDQLNAEQLSKPITMSSIVGSQAQINIVKQSKLNSIAADVGLLQAQAQGLQGQIDSAQATVDRSIDLKYKIEELNLKTYQAQLDAIQPELDKQEKIRAQAVELMVKEKEQAIQDKKDEDKMLANFNLDAMAKYPSANIKITDNYTTTQNKIKGSQEYKNAQAKASIADMSPALVSIGNSIGSKFDSSPIVKQYVEVQNKKLSIDSLLSSGSVSGPQDVALVYEFMKALDPTSVVRETEYATAAASGNIFQGAMARFNGWFSEKGGKLPESVRQEFQNIIDQKFSVAESQYNNLYDENARKLQAQGIEDPSIFLTQYKYDLNQNNNPEVPKIKLNASYSSSNGLINQQPELKPVVESLRSSGYTEGQIMEFVNQEYSGFNQPLSMGGNGSIKQQVAVAYPDGSTGGQCGDFAHKIVDFPSVGDSKQEKIASVNKYGIPKNEWTPQVGDVVITGENPTYGHVAVVNEVLPDGRVRLSESNYKQKTYGKEKVSNDRILNPNSSLVYGAIRGKLKTIS